MGSDHDSDAGGAEAEVSLDQFLEGSMDLLAVLDFSTRPLVLSRSWERVLGWTRLELFGRPLIELVHPEDLEFAASELGTLLTGHPTNPSDLRLQAKDGTYRWLQASASSVLASERIYLTATDIAARKALETALQQQMILEEAVASIAARLIGADHEELTATLSAAIGELAQMLGVDRAHFLRGSRRPEDATYVEWRDPVYGQRAHRPDAAEVVQAWWRDLLRSGELLALEDVNDLAEEAPEVVASLNAEGVKSVLLVPLPRQRRFWGFLAFVALREKVQFPPAVTHMLRLSGEAFLAALAQADSAVALEDARRELELRNDALERSNEDLERFAYVAAHDLRAPLNKVEMALAAVEARGGDALGGDAQAELLGIARRSSIRMRDLIEDLLRFSAVGRVTGRGASVALDDVLAEVLSTLDATVAETGATVDVGALPVVVGHRAQLGQLLQNLVANALKFHRDGVPPHVAITAGAVDDGVVLEVSDNGIGIAPSDRQLVFEAFTRLHPEERFSGTGIGLATCARVAEVHDGRIWVEDGIDGGTAVKVWLPSDRLAPG